MFPENCALPPYLKLGPDASAVANSSSKTVFHFANWGVGE
jgi:hypothetical protein